MLAFTISMTRVLQIDAKWRTFHRQADQEEQILTEMFVYASAWFLLSVIIGLPAGRTIRRSSVVKAAGCYAKEV
jgi:hypothetical protein